MTAQEQQMLQGLAERINGTQLPDKDPDAEQYLQMNIGNNPDALYILAQTVLVQQYALTQAQKQLADAKAQMDQMRQQPDQTKHSGSFLGNLLGMRDDSSRSQAPPPPPPPQQTYYQQPPQYAPVQNAAYPPYPPAYAPGGFAPAYGAPQSGGFLRSAMQTATGVAAGALAFEGIESLMHGFGGGGYGGGGFGGGFGGEGRPEEVINNYYGDDAGREHGGEHQSQSDWGGNDRGDYSVKDDTRADNVSDFGGDDSSSTFDDASNGGDDFGGGSNDDFNS